MRNSIASQMFKAFLVIALLALFIPAFSAFLFVDYGLARFEREQNTYRDNLVYSRILAQYKLTKSWDFLINGSNVDELTAHLGNIEAELYPLYFPFKEMIKPTEQNLEGAWWLSLIPNIIIFDGDGNFIAGNRARHQEARWVPFTIIEDNGQEEIVGYLGRLPEFYITSDSFQYKILGIYFGFVLLLVTCFCSIAVWILTKNFRKPLDKMKAATTKLANGDLSVRIKLERSDELGELAHNFNIMANELEANEISRRKWISDTSHELRTPLTVALGTIEGLRQGILPMNDNTLVELALSVSEMNELVGDLHDLAKVDAKKIDLQLEIFDLESIIQELEQVFAPSYVKQAISLEINYASLYGIQLNADRIRLKRVFINLLTNSIRYTDRGGKVIIYAKFENDILSIIQEDSAPCPQTWQINKIFDRFFRCDESRSKVFGGSGLGLAISKEIILLHKATIKAYPSKLGGLAIEISGLNFVI